MHLLKNSNSISNNYDIDIYHCLTRTTPNSILNMNNILELTTGPDKMLKVIKESKHLCYLSNLNV